MNYELMKCYKPLNQPSNQILSRYATCWQQLADK